MEAQGSEAFQPDMEVDEAKPLVNVVPALELVDSKVGLSPADGLPEVPLPEFALARAKMDELFVHWLSLRDTAPLLRGIVDDVAKGKPVVSPPMPSLLVSSKIRIILFLRSNVIRA